MDRAKGKAGWKTKTRGKKIKAEDAQRREEGDGGGKISNEGRLISGLAVAWLRH